MGLQLWPQPLWLSRLVLGLTLALVVKRLIPSAEALGYDLASERDAVLQLALSGRHSAV